MHGDIDVYGPMRANDSVHGFARLKPVVHLIARIEKVAARGQAEPEVLSIVDMRVRHWFAGGGEDGDRAGHRYRYGVAVFVQRRCGSTTEQDCPGNDTN